MNIGLLLGIATEVGLPMIEQILGGKIGKDNAALVRDVLGRVANRSGVSIDALPALAENSPEVVREAMSEVERMSPEILALYASGIELQLAELEASQNDPTWMRAWRPAGMYMIGFLWLWNAVFLHVLNAVFKIALPPVEWSILLQASAAYMGLYMGGHTAKDLAAKWLTKGGQT